MINGCQYSMEWEGATRGKRVADATALSANFGAEPASRTDSGCIPLMRCIAIVFQNLDSSSSRTIMTFGRSSPPPTQSSAKKQQSISSFFTPKQPAAKKVNAPKPSTTKRPSISNAPDLTNYAADTAVNSSPPRPKRPFEEYSDEDETPPDPKRTRQDASDLENEPPLPSVTQPYRPATASVPARVSDRTAKYIFSSSQPDQPQQHDQDDEAVRRQKERLHQKFVKKLGRPDSLLDIRRRNHFIDEEQHDGDDDLEEEEEEVPKPAKGRKGPAVRKSASKLTPMEKQVIDIKKKHMDTLLVVEVGYKFRFFGEDARVAAKELQIMCIPGKMRFDEHPSEAHFDKFAGASFPTHRLHVHVKRLVSAGHKVGVVRQLETAALKKAGDNRNTPFVRKLTNLYTKGTYIDDIEGLDGPVAAPAGGAPATGHLLCLTETNAGGSGTDEKVRLGIVAVQPTTGDVIYDDFHDGFMRSELETRLLHIAPCEFLIVGSVSKATEKLVEHLSGSRTNVFGDCARVERTEKSKTFAAQAHTHISDFYAGKMQSDNSSEEKSAMLDKVHQLSEPVTMCLSAMITHLTDYGLEHVFDLTKNFQSFSARSHMLLNGNTLSSLEIYQNQTDHTEKGSLVFILNRTQTRFGQRLLRKWVGRPLLDQEQLQKRIGAVEEFLDSDRAIPTDRIKNLLAHVRGDLEKSLIRIYYKKCARPELVSVLQTLQKISNEYSHVKVPEDSGFKSPLLAEAIASLPLISEDVISYLERIDLQAAKDDDKYSFFRDMYETEEITDHKVGIAAVEHDLDEHRTQAAETLKKTGKVNYVTVSGIEFLIEIENIHLKRVPASWAKISGTKKVSRFHTPEVVKLIRERDRSKEALANACDAAFAELLTEIGTKYQTFRDCIQSLATLDCLLSLADIASQPGYTKPEFITESDEVRIEVKEGRHPMVEQILLDTYVPNDIELSSNERALLITGPNMGGKSSYVRSVALISIMAQIGSWVPASQARLTPLDAVFTRMGAFDNMLKGESTFMVELSETSDILKQATPRSLIILDELGRGTSTHDGVAIAQAVLDYVVRETKALTLFITHYQALSKMAERYEARELRNVHMSFTEEVVGDDHTDITFLYEVSEGVAHRSYGLNVARLAGLPKDVLDVAAIKSTQMEEEANRRKMAHMSRLLSSTLEDEQPLDSELLMAGLEMM
jgi:DNA mismatch repair protein MSH3